MKKKYSSAKDLAPYFESVYGRVKNTDEVYNFFDSSLEEALLPKKQILAAMRPLFVKDVSYGFSYDIPNGHLGLRETVAERYLGNRNLAKDVIITAGAQEALYLALNYLARKKKRLTVAIEEFIYLGFRQIIEEFNCKLVEIPLQKNGLNTDFLEEELRNRNIDLLYTIPDLQNPTGVTLSKKKRVQIKRLQQKYNFNIIVDLAYRDLYYNDIYKMPLASLIGPNNFIVGTFSKTIFPSLRIGWLYAPQNSQSISLMKRSINLFQPSFLQVSVDEFLKKDYDNYLSVIKYVFIEKKKYLQFLLEYYGLNKYFTWNDPKGSYYLWLKVKPPAQIKISKFMSKNVIVAPGTFFNPLRGKDYIRLCYSKLTCIQLWQAVSIISSIYGEDKRSIWSVRLLLRTVWTLVNIRATILTQRFFSR